MTVVLRNILLRLVCRVWDLYLFDVPLQDNRTIRGMNNKRCALPCMIFICFSLVYIYFVFHFSLILILKSHAYIIACMYKNSIKLDDLSLFSMKFFQRLKRGVAHNATENQLYFPVRSIKVCIWINRARMKVEDLLLFLLHLCLYETLAVVSWLTALLLLCRVTNSSPPGQSPHLCIHTCKTMTTLAQMFFYFILLFLDDRF